MTHISTEYDRDISYERGRIARDIDDLTSTKSENMRDSTRMETVSWRIEDDGISFTILRGELFGEVLDFCIDEFYICDAISVRIFDSILTRGCHELNTIYFWEIFGKEDPDRTSSCIEIKKYSSLILDRVDHSAIEFLRSESIDLEERLRLYLECESEELISDYG